MIHRPPQKMTRHRPKPLPRGNFFALKFRPRFWIDFGSILPPQMPPFWHPFRAQNRSKNRSEIGLLKKSLQDRPKTAQDRPKMPPGPPRSPQDALPDPPGRPKMPSRIPLGRPKRLFRSTWPSTFFRRGSLYNSLVICPLILSPPGLVKRKD